MLKRFCSDRAITRCGSFIAVVLIAALLLPSAPLLAPAAGAPPRAVETALQADGRSIENKVQPSLRELAATQPEQSVAIIVQKAGQGKGAETAIAQLGGQLTKDLHIINAFAAQVPAKAVSELAGLAEVKWISLDASTMSATQELTIHEVSTPTTIALEALRDTYLAEDDAGRNFGSCASLATSGKAKSNDRVLSYFDLSGIPRSCTINSASLVMKVREQSDSGATTVTVHRALSDWSEGAQCNANGAANWNSRTAGTSWNTPGGDYDPTPLSSTSVGGAASYAWNVTSLVQDWVTGAAPNFGFVLAQTDKLWKAYDSSESATSTNRPRLQLSYTCADEGLTLTNLLTATPAQLTSGNQFVVTMTLTSDQKVAVVTPAALTITSANGATAVLVSGPTPASAAVGPRGTPFTWIYRASGSGMLTIGGDATGGGAKWPWAQSAYISVRSSTPPVFVTWATTLGSAVNSSFNNAAAIHDSPLGPNGKFGSGTNTQGAFAGFAQEVTPGYVISKVEVVLRTYAAAALGAGEDPSLQIYVNGQAGASVTMPHGNFDSFVGAAKAGIMYFDVTKSRKTWRWSDFDNGLEVLIDQSKIKNGHTLYYDAVGLRIYTTPGIESSSDPSPAVLGKEAISTSRLVNVYDRIVRATDVWNEAPGYLQGQGIAVAIVDSGIVKSKDITGRLLKSVNFNPGYHDSNDRYGHGTFVSNVVAGDGKDSGGVYIGIAPKTNLINVRVSDDQGMGTESDVVNALQWVLENKKYFNIRVVNLSLNSSMWQSYHTSPLDAACEILWFNGIVVVVAAGNNGAGILYPPANDPFVITVGATSDAGTVDLGDDEVANFSAYGSTENGRIKPELVAPGRNIVALLGDNRKLTMAEQHPANRVNDQYFRMSGTSVSAPIVSGAVTLLLQDEPGLNPDQVKYRLMVTANHDWPGYDAQKAGAGLLDIYAAIHSSTTATANTGLPASRLLWSGTDPVAWGSVNWTSVNWTSVNWTSVNWTSVNWTSVNWTSDHWDVPGGPAGDPDLSPTSPYTSQIYLPTVPFGN